MLLNFYPKLVTEKDKPLYQDIKCIGKNHEIGRILDKLCRSLNMKITTCDEPESFDDILEGYLSSKNGMLWQTRWDNWASSKSGNPPEYWLGMENGVIYVTDSTDVSVNKYWLLPIFPHYKFDISILKEEATTMKSLNKDFADKMLNQNQDAVKLAAKMSVGKTANQVLTGKLQKTFPWYAKLLGKHKEVANNPFVRLGTAEAVLAAVQHFYPENTKLKYVAEAMLQESMVDVATNSKALESVIGELEALAGQLPGETK